MPETTTAATTGTWTEEEIRQQPHLLDPLAQQHR
jgi:hypothetical protein